MDIIEQLESKEIQRLASARGVPAFGPGDTLRVSVKVVEGTRERVQAFEGVCIARKNAGVNSSFTVRKISYGEGVERVFPLFSPNIVEIEVKRRGDVRRAKLYYLRGRRGKRARIAEKTTGGTLKNAIRPEDFEGEDQVANAAAMAETDVAPPVEAGTAAPEGGTAKKD